LETFEKSKENWSHELRHASTTTKTKVSKVRTELKTTGTADLNTTTTYATKTVPLEWQTQHFIRTASCEADP